MDSTVVYMLERERERESGHITTDPKNGSVLLKNWWTSRSSPCLRKRESERGCERENMIHHFNCLICSLEGMGREATILTHWDFRRKKVHTHLHFICMRICARIQHNQGTLPNSFIILIDIFGHSLLPADARHSVHHGREVGS